MYHGVHINPHAHLQQKKKAMQTIKIKILKYKSANRSTDPNKNRLGTKRL